MWIDDYPPSGCRRCGVGQRLHFSRYFHPDGWHQYQPPTTEQIKERMIARREGRVIVHERHHIFGCP